MIQTPYNFKEKQLLALLSEDSDETQNTCTHFKHGYNYVAIVDCGWYVYVCTSWVMVTLCSIWVTVSSDEHGYLIILYIAKWARKLS